MNNPGLPVKQGLYDPQFEHDACGIGFVANIKGKKSNAILRQSLTVLENLSHRGGVGSEPETGDGAGILLQIPHSFFEKACGGLGFALPAAGDYGTGIIFLPFEADKRAACERKVETVTAEEGLTVLGWRDVPVNPAGLGKSALACMPFMRQVFIGRGNDTEAGLAFERKLYIIRRRCENAIRYADDGSPVFYVPSLSSRTIVYKGMLTAEQMGTFYLDLLDETVETALAMVHSRYSTNTFPSWERAHPNRYLIHNGEINTLRGNVNRMKAREGVLNSPVYGGDLSKLLPVVTPDGSDSAMFDNTVEFLLLGGVPLHQAMAMLIPEPWSGHESMSDEKKAFYQFESCLMEPWDGPAAMGFTDGVRIGATLDRNGLRPSRYWVTSDDMIVLSSEAGVLDIPASKVVAKERLQPGRMLLIDTEKGRIIGDEELKHELASASPYREWLDRYLVDLDKQPAAPVPATEESAALERLQKVFGYSYEDLRVILQPMAKDGIEPVGAMGTDIPLAVLSKRPQMLYDYFKQLFAQVTNPPIDALRETIVTSSEVLLGAEGNLLTPSPETAHRLRLHAPVISNEELSKIRALSGEFASATLPILFDPAGGGKALEAALAKLFADASAAVRGGAVILILSDRGVSGSLAPIPALLAVAGLHHHLIREGLRTRTSLVLESGEPREMHHFACLIAYGASAVNPWLACQSVTELVRSGYIPGGEPEKNIAKYLKAASKGVIKILSKMGISTVQSYQGAQIYEALGLDSDFVDKYFTLTPARIGGIGPEEVAREAALRHEAAFAERPFDTELESGGLYQYRRDGEYHLYNPETITALQRACREGDYGLFKEYSRLIDGEQELATLRGLLRFKPGSPVPIGEVESVDEICRRFKTGAMSFGSISREVHEAMAIAMNRLRGKSNTGEGGEDPARFTPDANGDSRCSAIKQVASGRFGVTGEYLANSIEIQIKMAQGAKPGEGGQLPGKKVSPYVARVRHSTPGVGLISPPPHHDIYSIEDLKQLIHDLKCANPSARISVKLVSEAGVGTIAAGVAKGLADVILISGYDGGTGASPRTSTRHAGLPWELGISETHQTLLLNDLRSRVVLETDGKLMTGRDVAIACMLGAEEFGFATAPLVVLGCVMMRVCNLDTCPVGIATQNPALRKNFTGKPEHLVNFMHFIAQELREIMAQLGVRTINELVGRSDLLEAVPKPDYWKTRGIDLSALLFRPELPEGVGSFCVKSQDHGLENSLDERAVLAACAPAVERGEKVSASFAIRNIDRTACTILGSAISKKYGAAGLPDGTIDLTFTGAAGQSFGAFVPKGVSMTLVGDTNDYLGKGLSGGRIVLKAPDDAAYAPEKNIIAGNVALYGATSGEAYIGGAAGERFCVRNSGASAVVEAVGDHGCEYMTGGRVVVLGKTGRNFAAGMSGGIAYVYDPENTFPIRFNGEMADLETVETEKEALELRALIENHARLTGSAPAKAILADWKAALPHFKKVMPRDFKRMLTAIENAHKEGLEGEEALMAAFDANNRDLARVAGN